MHWCMKAEYRTNIQTCTGKLSSLTNLAVSLNTTQEYYKQTPYNQNLHTYTEKWYRKHFQPVGRSRKLYTCVWKFVRSAVFFPVWKPEMKSAAACIWPSVGCSITRTGKHSSHTGTLLLLGPAGQSYCCWAVEQPSGDDSTSVGVWSWLANTSASSLSSSAADGSILHFTTESLATAQAPT